MRECSSERWAKDGLSTSFPGAKHPGSIRVNVTNALNLISIQRL